jgi:hypothetical protein
MKKNDGAHIKYSGITPTGYVKKTNPGWGEYDWDDNEFQDMVKKLLEENPEIADDWDDHPDIRRDEEGKPILHSIKDYANIVGGYVVEDTSSTASSSPHSSSSSSDGKKKSLKKKSLKKKSLKKKSLKKKSLKKKSLKKKSLKKKIF